MTIQRSRAAATPARSLVHVHTELRIHEQPDPTDWFGLVNRITGDRHRAQVTLIFAATMLMAIAILLLLAPAAAGTPMALGLGAWLGRRSRPAPTK
jgi:hypothetical protein